MSGLNGGGLSILGGGGGGGGGGSFVNLTYATAGPFPVPVAALPTGYVPGTGTVALSAQLTVGTNIGSGLLLDASSNPIPDGWTFPATIFVEGGVIYDIIAVNPFTVETQGGIVVWGASGGVPQPLYIPGGIRSVGPVIFNNLPTTNPDVSGQLWNNDGVATVSGSPGYIYSTQSGTGSITGGWQLRQTVDPLNSLSYMLVFDTWNSAADLTITFPTAYIIGNGANASFVSPTPTLTLTTLTVPHGSAITGVVLVQGT